jgi:hypothetical protein
MTHSDISRSWLYRRYLVADGNFVLDHLANRRGRDGVRLTSGAAYMAEPVRYGKHVKAAREGQEVSFAISEAATQLLWGEAPNELPTCSYDRQSPIRT